MPTATAPLRAIAAELRASPVPPDPSDLITVNAVHLALWRSTIANARHATSSYVNGMITNDKFCTTRACVLPLSWWRCPKSRRP